MLVTISVGREGDGGRVSGGQIVGDVGAGIGVERIPGISGHQP